MYREIAGTDGQVRAIAGVRDRRVRATRVRATKVQLYILTSIRFYFTLLAGNFLIFLSSAVFFKISLLYSSQRVNFQFGFRSGPIFCWS